MKQLKEILEKSACYLEARGIGSPRRQAEEVIADALGLKRLDLYLQFDRPVNETELDLCRQVIARRGKGEPGPYISGNVSFYDCELKVDRRVLIPRPETEILVDAVCRELETLTLEGKVFWDLCTGSGCIGIAVKKKFPQLEVVLSDVSVDALAVAKENAELNQVDVTMVQGDLLTPFFGQKADFVACNPPYIPADEFRSLEREVREFEPQQALIAENDGLDFYQRLANDLPHCLRPGAKAWFEAGYNQGAALMEIFSGSHWKHCRYEQDWSGHDRFFFLEIE